MSYNDRERIEETGKKIKRETDVFGLQQENILGINITRQQLTCLNTITPCAACKLLRRRCGQECPFFPYFPPHEPDKFASVHRVFGASNVSKMLMEVPEEQRADAANSIVYEAILRLRDPVYGCMGVISALQQQLLSLQAELNAVRAQIILHGHHKLSEPMAQQPEHVSLDSSHQSMGDGFRTIQSENDSYFN